MVNVENNTIVHDTGSAVRLDTNNQPVVFYNNIIVINSGLGLEILGSATTLDSNYNLVFPARPGANVGKYLAQPISATLAAWRTASGKDAASLSADPLFIDPNGSDNLLGWTQANVQSQFADFGADDNFHLKAHSPAIDAANSDVAPALDAEGNARIDDLGTPNNGVGVYRFYDLGALEFTGSSSDITPPTLTAIVPIGVSGPNLSNTRLSALTLHFSEPLQPVSAQSLAAYVLVEAGSDGILGNLNDVTVNIASANYVPGSLEVSLNLGGTLPQGLYRLTLLGSAIVDRSGNALDGDANGTAGGNFTRDFQLDLTAPVVGSVTPSGSVATPPTRFTVVFQENLQMDAASAGNSANYVLTSSVDELFGNADDVNESSRITNVAFDAAAKTATLTLSGPLPPRHYQLTVRSTITDQVGNPLGNGANYISAIEVGVPVLNPIGNQAVYDSTQLTANASATDPDHTGALTFSLGAGALAGMNITAGGAFTWTPDAAFAGTIVSVTIRVTDQNVPPLSDSETIAINVLPNPAPVLQSTTVNNGSAQRSIVSSLTLQFNTDVSASFSLSDLQLVNTETGATVSAGAMALSNNPVTNQATLTFPGLPGQKLADGNYRLTLLAAGILGPHGKAMAANATFDFFALTGDVNGDRVVNATDLLLVWQELSKPPASRNLNQDVNGDGQVTQADVDLVKAHYLASLPAPPVVVQSAVINDGQTQRSRLARVTLQFNANVGASLSAADLILRNVSTQTTISGLTVSFDPATNRATITITGLPTQGLPDGNYDLAVLAAGVTDAQGNPLSADYHLAFFILAGDANGDRVVNDRDLLQVWQELARPISSRNLNSDLNGDGLVTQADVDVVKTHYLASLPSPAALPPIGFATAVGGTDSIVAALTPAPVPAPAIEAPLPNDADATPSPAPGLIGSAIPAAPVVGVAPPAAAPAAQTEAPISPAVAPDVGLAAPSRPAVSLTSRTRNGSTTGLSADLGPLSTSGEMWATFPARPSASLNDSVCGQTDLGLEQWSWCPLVDPKSRWPTSDSTDGMGSHPALDDFVGTNCQRMASQRATRHL